jgi:hypothetical protein
MFANVHVQQMQQQLQQRSHDELMQQQLGVFDCLAAAGSAAGEAACSTASADAMVQPCTVIMACCGSYTLMVVSERLQDAEAAAAAEGTAAAHRSPVLEAVLSCAQQLLVEHENDLQQQLDLSQLPAVFAQVSPTAAAPAATSEEQQQQQQQQQQPPQQQEARSNELPRLRLIVASRNASAVSTAGDAAGSSAVSPVTPSRARQLHQLLLCGGTSCDDAAGSRAAGLLLSADDNSPAAVRGTASNGGLHQSHILSNPGTPTAANAKQHNSSSSSPFSRIKKWLLVRGFSSSFRSRQGGSAFKSSSSSSSGSLPGSPHKLVAGPSVGLSKCDKTSSRLSSSSGAADGFGIVHSSRSSADGARNSSNSGQQQAVMSAAAGVWCVVRSAQHLPGKTDDKASKSNSSNAGTWSSGNKQHGSTNAGTGYRRSAAGCGSVEPSAAAAGAAVLTVDWQQGTFTLAMPPPAGKMLLAKSPVVGCSRQKVLAACLHSVRYLK